MLNRLTALSDRGTHYFPECFERCGGDPKDCKDCDYNIKICEALAAYEETGLSPEQIKALKNQTFNNITLPAAFSETEEQLNNELTEAIRILNRSPMFEGRVTIAIVISSGGKEVRPILYKTKYTPRKQDTAQIPFPGQASLFEE